MRYFFFSFRNMSQCNDGALNFRINFSMSRSNVLLLTFSPTRATLVPFKTTSKLTNIANTLNRLMLSTFVD